MWLDILQTVGIALYITGMTVVTLGVVIFLLRQK